jgi:hypothetical protein
MLPTALTAPAVVILEPVILPNALIAPALVVMAPVAITAPDSPGSIAYLDFTNEVIRYEQNSKIRAAS